MSELALEFQAHLRELIFKGAALFLLVFGTRFDHLDFSKGGVALGVGNLAVVEEIAMGLLGGENRLLLLCECHGERLRP